MNRLKDLRAYIAALQEIGEVQSIDQEVDWNLEIGAIIRRSYDLRVAAPLFTTIKGYKPGFRVLGAPGGVSRQPGLEFSRIALSLDLDARASGQEIIEALADAHKRALIPPREVATAPDGLADTEDVFPPGEWCAHRVGNHKLVVIDSLRAIVAAAQARRAITSVIGRAIAEISPICMRWKLSLQATKAIRIGLVDWDMF